MRQRLKNDRARFLNTAMAAIAAIGLVFSATTADAGGYKHKYGFHGKHYKHYKHYGGATILLGTLGYALTSSHKYKHHYGYKSHGYRHYGSYRHKHKYYKRRFWKHHYAADDHYGYSRKCHAVKKVGYWHGYKAKIGGTACKDGYGGYYIVKGSRYLIRYLH